MQSVQKGEMGRVLLFLPRFTAYGILKYFHKRFRSNLSTDFCEVYWPGVYEYANEKYNLKSWSNRVLYRASYRLQRN